jgi:hypothetical protein
MSGAGWRLYRLSVTYGVAEDGTLRAVGPPTGRVRATGEGLLYRGLATLADAGDVAIAAGATRLGPLGPLGEVAASFDAQRFGWVLGEAMTDLVDQVDEVRRSVARGVQGRRSLAAHLLVAVAGIDPDLVTGLLAALDPNASLTSAERARLRDLLWREFLALLARYSAQGETIVDDLARGDEVVHVTIPPGVTAERLRLATAFLETTQRAMGRDGGAGAVFGPGSLGRFATLLSPYEDSHGSPIDVPETCTAWRSAGREMRVWRESVRLLRALAAGQDVAPGLEAVLGELRTYAAVDGLDQTGLPSVRVQSPDTLRGRTASLLTLRLQQVDAWPLPHDEVVGAFGRSLWSLWRPITDTSPPRECQWRDGCTRLLPADAHANLRYCREHQREAPRARAERNRGRRGLRSASAGG